MTEESGRAASQLLLLPPDWGTCGAGELAEYLLRQVEDKSLRAGLGSVLVHATLHLSLVGRQKWARRRIKLKKLAFNRFQAGELLYVYFAQLDDDALQSCIDLGEAAASTVLVVPTNHDLLLRAALQTAFRFRPPSVCPFDGFNSQRIAFAAVDLGWPHPLALREMLHTVNRLTTELNANEAITVAIPDQP
jgi:hypothetical protein